MRGVTLRWPEHWAWWDSIVALIMLFVVPGILGLVTGLLKSSRIPGYMLGLLDLPSPYLPDTGWACAFYRREACLVGVICADGRRIFGVLNTCSLASARSKEQDLFLEQTFICNDDDGTMTLDMESRGMWIPGREIRRLELFRIPNHEQNTEQ
jgi:hypothetical protein